MEHIPAPPRIPDGPWARDTYVPLDLPLQEHFLRREQKRGGSLLARHLAGALERLAARLRSGGSPDISERVLPMLTTLTGAAAEAAPPERARDRCGAMLTEIDDPRAARAAMQSIQQLQDSLLSGVLSYLSAAGDSALEIERTFGVLSQGQQELIDHWFGSEPLRQADLLAGVFHDLRSPLTSILFLADALHSGQSGELSPTQKQQMRLIYAASLTLLTLVDNVLSSRNLEAGDVQPEVLPFSLSAVSDEVERITRPLAEQHGLRLHFERECCTARRGDPDALRRILLNLVANAIAHTEEGGVTVHFQDQDDGLQVLVEDTGPGIDEAELAELFQPFRPGGRARREGARRFSGAGLGLSICHRLARLAGGDIAVDTEPGNGSCFMVRLPFGSGEVT